MIRASQFFAALMLLLFAGIAAAEDYYVDITNKTGYTIVFAYVSPMSSDSWEEDVLGKSVLKNGDTTRVNLRNYSSPWFDIKLQDEDGDTYM